MLTLESAKFEIANLPEPLAIRIKELGLTVDVIASPNMPESVYLKATSTAFDIGIDLDSDTLPAEISGWILRDFCAAVEAFSLVCGFGFHAA